MASQGEDDLQASKTEGFKVGEKKTVEEYAKLGKAPRVPTSPRIEILSDLSLHGENSVQATNT